MWVTCTVGTGIMSMATESTTALLYLWLKKSEKQEEPFLGPSAITAKAVYTSGGK
jgi:hypothetical protein